MRLGCLRESLLPHFLACFTNSRDLTLYLLVSPELVCHVSITASLRIRIWSRRVPLFVPYLSVTNPFAIVEAQLNLLVLLLQSVRQTTGVTELTFHEESVLTHTLDGVFHDIITFRGLCPAALRDPVCGL